MVNDITGAGVPERPARAGSAKYYITGEQGV